MATHKETSLRKRALLEYLRAAYAAGTHPEGEALSLRALGERFELSMQTVGAQLQILVAEGVLYTVPRVGTFLGRNPARAAEPFLLLSRHPRSRNSLVDKALTGFEERIARENRYSLTLAHGDSSEWLTAEALAATAGLFVFDALPDSCAATLANLALPVVGFGTENVAGAVADRVNFDDEGGGRVATRHLLDMGHRRVAYLGLHHGPTNHSGFLWSAKRATGWKQMMATAGLESHGLELCPQRAQPVTRQEQREAAEAMAQSLVQDPSITAVVAANCYAASGLMAALRSAALPSTLWPAIVTFDNAPDDGQAAVTYLRLPWEKLGEEAAQLLLQRRSGALTGAPRRVLVPMSLIPRLTCRRHWAGNSILANMSLHAMAPERQAEPISS